MGFTLIELLLVLGLLLALGLVAQPIYQNYVQRGYQLRAKQTYWPVPSVCIVRPWDITVIWAMPTPMAMALAMGTVALSPQRYART